MKANIFWGLAGVLFALAAAAPALAKSADPDLIFRKSTTFKLLTPNDKLAVYGIDDPLVEGVACHYTAPEKGGLAGAFGLAEQTSDISLACRQYGPIKFKGKFEQGEVVFSERRSLFFKKMQIVRGCDVKRNILVYMTYSDKLIDGSPKNSTSTVPIEPWGRQAARCRNAPISCVEGVAAGSIAAGDDIGLGARGGRRGDGAGDVIRAPERERRAMAVRLAPGVGDHAAAFAALAEAILDPIAVIGRDDEGMRFARPAAVDLRREKDKSERASTRAASRDGKWRIEQLENQRSRGR